MEAHGNGLHIECWDCGHVARWDGAMLADRFGPERTAADVYPLLSCSACKVGRINAHEIGMGVGNSWHPRAARYRPGYGPRDK